MKSIFTFIAVFIVLTASAQTPDSLIQLDTNAVKLNGLGSSFQPRTIGSLSLWITINPPVTFIDTAYTIEDDKPLQAITGLYDEGGTKMVIMIKNVYTGSYWRFVGFRVIQIDADVYNYKMEQYRRLHAVLYKRLPYPIADTGFAGMIPHTDYAPTFSPEGWGLTGKPNTAKLKKKYLPKK